MGSENRIRAQEMEIEEMNVSCSGGLLAIHCLKEGSGSNQSD